MYITHAGTRYQVKAVQTTVCPAGSAYWLIQVHEVLHSRLNDGTGEIDRGEVDDMAIVTIDTGAIYGSPTLANYIERIKTAINDFWAKANS